MEIAGHLIVVFISIALVNNLVLTKFLGICPYLGVSRKVDMAFGMGCAVTFVITISGTMTWIINNLILQKIGMEYLKYIAFIMVIASMVQLVEMYVRKFFGSLYESFGIFLPLITTNCAILGTCLFIDLWEYDFLEALVASFGGGLGFTLVICMMGGIRENLEWADVP
ncbi:MAG: electron transporter RnfA, partial [Phycisphaerae bacterium SM23_30]